MKLMRTEPTHVSACESAMLKSQNSLQLSKQSILRIILSLILADAQDQCIRLGKATTVTPLRHSLKSAYEGLIGSDFNHQISIESELGLDSLARLSVISRLARFFDLSETGIDDYFLIEDSLNGWISLVSDHQSICASEPKVTFQTSGSTGAPKFVTHRVSKLLREVDALLSDLELNSRERVVSLVPPHHIFGYIFSILLPERARISNLDLSNFGPSAAGRHSKAGDLIVGSTFNWKRLFASGSRLSSGTVGVTSGGRTDPSLWSAVKDTGLTRFVDVYGSTETGGIAWRDDAHAGFRLLPHLLREGEHIKDSRDARIDLQDELLWCDEGRFRVCDRIDLCIKVGGVNVSLSYVERVLLSSGLFDEIFVRASDERIKAFAVVSSDIRDVEAINAKAIDFCNKNLEAPARPQQFTFGSLAPRNGMGKIQDW